MRGPLTGIRVLDCTVALAGPFCGLLLADLGADVIKVEGPDSDSHISDGSPAYKSENGHFLVVNRNKRGLTVDLKQERGRELFYRLVRTADVLVQNYRPGVMKRLGCDWETVREINPRLVYCSISGFGEASPYADLAGLDLIAQGMSGLMSVTGDPAGGEPVKVGTPVTDMGAGMYGALGIVSALYYRQASGRGQHVEATLLDTPISWLTWRAAEYWGTRRAMGKHRPIEPALPGRLPNPWTARTGQRRAVFHLGRPSRQPCGAVTLVSASFRTTPGGGVDSGVPTGGNPDRADQDGR